MPKCRFCKFDIPEEAIVCNQCKRYQGRLVNLILTVGALSGGLTIIVGILTYLISSVPPLYRSASGRDTNIISVYYNSAENRHSASVGNSGAEAIYLRDLQFHFPTEKESVASRSRSLNVEVAPGSIGVKMLTERKKLERRYSVVTANDLPKDYTLSGELIRKILQYEDCFTFRILDRDSHASSVTRGFVEGNGASLVYAAHETYLRYYSASKAKVLTKKLTPLRYFIRVAIHKNAMTSRVTLP